MAAEQGGVGKRNGQWEWFVQLVGAAYLVTLGLRTLLAEPQASSLAAPPRAAAGGR